MKLHTFDAEIEGKRFRAFTRDKARRALCGLVNLSDIGVQIDQDDWNYVGTKTTPSVANQHIRNIKKEVKKNGFAIVGMPSICKHFFVFDIELDIADLRVYSNDKNLSDFNKFRRSLELSPQGSRFEGKEAIFVGELDIPDPVAANNLGLDYERLQTEGFQVVVVRFNSDIESVRRSFERKFRKTFPEFEKKYGVKITGFSTVIRRTDNKCNQCVNVNKNNTTNSQNIDIKIENKNIVSSVNGGDSSQKSILDSWIVKLVGFVAAVVSLWIFFAN